jgi:serine/threonine protein kinase
MRPARYVLLDQIGSGATGRVHLARDRALRRYVAVKVLHPGHVPPGPALDHPHVLAHQVHDGLVVMPLVRGGSLLDLCAQEGRLPEAYVAVLLGQLLQALEVVHAAGVVHRDVKPANLLLEATGAGRPHLRLADFGDESTVGTPGYLAPERAAGAPATVAQDVYAVGVVVRRLLDRPGPLATLADSMTRAEPARRPDAAQALTRLRELPVPRPLRWPVVPDRLGPLLRRR